MRDDNKASVSPGTGGKRTCLTLSSLAVCLFLSSCATTVNYRTLNNQVQAVVKEGDALIKEGKVDEGVKMIQMAEQLHPADPKLESLLRSVPPEKSEILEENPLLGFNKARLKASVDPSLAESILWYIPDRFKDFVNMFSLDVSVGPQLGAGAWLTRAAQLNAFVGATGGIGYYQKSLLGLRGESSFDFAVGPVGATAVMGGRAGIGGIATTASTTALHMPSQDLYQDYRDYWAVGFKVGFFLVGGEVEYHPIEIVDFLAGIILIDPLHDDWATTRRLQYSRAQRSMMKELRSSIKDAGRKGVKAYGEQYPTVFPSPGRQPKPAS